jgi:hypothetical protein
LIIEDDHAEAPATAITNPTVAQEKTAHGHTGIFDPQVTQYVGLSIITGFTIMLILDQGFLIAQERASKLSRTNSSADSSLDERDERNVINPTGTVLDPSKDT